MGKFSSNTPRQNILIDDDVIKDIQDQLSRGRQVVIVHNHSESSRNAASLLLKKLPTDDVYRVRPIEEGAFEHQRAIDPKTDYYRISAEGVLKYLFSIRH